MPCRVGDVAGGIEVVVQVGQRAADRQRRRRTTHCDPSACGPAQVATGAGGQRHRQTAGARIEIGKVHRRQVDVATDILGDGNVSRQDSCVGGIIVDRADVDVDAAEIDVGTSTRCTCVAVVVDRDLNRIGIVAVEMHRAVQIADVAGGIEVVVQVGQRAADRQRRRRTTQSDPGACGPGQVATGAGGQGHGQTAAGRIDIGKGHGRQVDVATDILGDGNVGRQASRVGGRIVGRTNVDVDGTEIDVSTSRRCAGVAVVVDLDLNRIDIIPVEIHRALQVADVAGRIEVRYSSRSAYR